MSVLSEQGDEALPTGSHTPRAGDALDLHSNRSKAKVELRREKASTRKPTTEATGWTRTAAGTAKRSIAMRFT